MPLFSLKQTNDYILYQGCQKIKYQIDLFIFLTTKNMYIDFCTLYMDTKGFYVHLTGSYPFSEPFGTFSHFDEFFGIFVLSPPGLNLTADKVPPAAEAVGGV